MKIIWNCATATVMDETFFLISMTIGGEFIKYSSDVERFICHNELWKHYSHKAGNCEMRERKTIFNSVAGLLLLLLQLFVLIIFAEKRVWKIKCLLCSAFHCNSHTEETNFMLRFEELSYDGAEGDAPVVWIPFEKWHFCEKWNENCRCELFSNRFQSTFNLLLRLSG